MKFAFDKSMRTYDADGRLHVKVSNISKAAVNPYYGYEIPGYKELGLDANTVYKLLRDPVELEKAAPTFNNLQLLSRHVPVNAADPKHELVVGSTGTDACFEAPYLKNSLVVWDQELISRIESEEQRELSSAYRYTPRMEPGEYLGESYDGVMTNIIGNHVALVDVGRAGSDVVVGDSKPIEVIPMKFSKKEFKARVMPLLAQDSALTYEQFVALAKKGIDSIKPFLAQDIELESGELAELIQSAGQAELNEQAAGQDDLSEMIAKASPEIIEKIRALLSGTAQDEEPGEEETVKDTYDKPAMDAAINAAAKVAEENAAKRFTAIRKAEKDVQPLVGEVAAMDSAEAIYKYALDSAGVDLTGVHESAYPALVKMLIAHKSTKTTVNQSIAQDAANASAEFNAMFPGAAVPKRAF